MTLFPAFLKLQNRPVLVVGGGAIAANKIPSLLEAGAHITVVAPKLNCDLAQLVRDRRIDWLPKPFEPACLQGKFLVIAATSLRKVNESVFQEADKRQILCNAVDDIDHCHFYYGAIVQRGDLQIAISTNGKSPALAQRLRKELEQQFGPEYANWLDHLGATRENLRANSTNPESTKQQLHNLASQEMFNQFYAPKPVAQGESSIPAALTDTPNRMPHTLVLHMASRGTPSSLQNPIKIKGSR
jgi:siroheme synthase-like protein